MVCQHVLKNAVAFNLYLVNKAAYIDKAAYIVA